MAYTGILGLSGLGDFTLTGIPQDANKNRTSQLSLEVLRSKIDKLRITQSKLEVLTRTLPKNRITEIVVEVLRTSIATQIYNNSLTFIGNGSIIFAGGTTYSRDVTFTSNSTISFVDGLAYSRTLTFTSTADVSFISGFVSGTTLNLTNGSTFTASAQFVYIRLVIDVLEPIQQVDRLVMLNVSAFNSLNILQLLRGGKVYLLSANNTITLISSVQRVIPFSLINNLLLSQALSKNKIAIKRIANTFNLMQAVNRQINYKRNLISNLTFQTQHGLFNSDSAEVILVPRNCYVLLESQQRSILLPCPLFDDKLDSTNQIIVKRTLNNDLRTYVKSSPLQKISYTFEVGRLKSLELESFLMAYLNQQIRMTNFKGELWLVKILTNPIEFITNSRWDPLREKLTVTLELEGVKIKG